MQFVLFAQSQTRKKEKKKTIRKKGTNEEELKN